MDLHSVNAADVNILAEFLAHEEILNLSTGQSFDCIVLVGSAILHCAETVFAALEENRKLTKTLVITGGIGHSTTLLYEAIANEPRYRHLGEQVRGLPEARALWTIFEHAFHGEDVAKSGCRILIEDRSTNCGANAVETRNILVANHIPTPKTMVIVQDPTMSLRTIASFEKAYDNVEDPPRFVSCPTFVPRVRQVLSRLEYDMGVKPEGLWEMNRFLSLVIGEIPRLRDDREGYGPTGKGFITSVDVPGDMEAAWSRLNEAFKSDRS